MKKVLIAGGLCGTTMLTAADKIKAVSYTHLRIWHNGKTAGLSCKCGLVFSSK